MAYNPNILLDSQFKPAPDKLNSLASILAEKQRMRIEDQAASDASRAAGNANVLSGQSQAEGAMTLEANQAIHPQIMSELQGQQPQQQPNLPPWLAQKPQEAPVQPGQLPPYLQRPQAQGPAPQPVQDRYAPMEQGINQDQALLDQKKQHLAVASFDPRNPTGFLAEKDKNSQALADEQKQIEGRRFSLGINRAWDQAAPGLNDAIQSEMKTNGSINQAAYNRILGQVNQVISQNPTLTKADGYKEFVALLEKNKPQPQPTMVKMMMAPVSNSVLDNAAQRIADRKSTLSEEIAKGRWIGPKAMEMHDQLVQKVAALDPNFSEQETESGAAYAKSPKVRNSIQQLDNAYSTVGRLKDVYSKLDNGQFPTLNRAVNAGKVQMGDVNAARAAIGQVLGNDELTQAFARGGTGSDKLREMSEKLSDPNGSPQQLAAQFDELLQGVKRSRAAYETQGGGYIHPMKESVPAAGQAVKISSAAEFAALPSGSLWINSKGETHRKK